VTRPLRPLAPASIQGSSSSCARRRAWSVLGEALLRSMSSWKEEWKLTSVNKIEWRECKKKWLCRIFYWKWLIISRDIQFTNAVVPTMLLYVGSSLGQAHYFLGLNCCKSFVHFLIFLFTLYSSIHRQISSSSAARKIIALSLIKISLLYMETKRIYEVWIPSWHMPLHLLSCKEIAFKMLFFVYRIL